MSAVHRSTLVDYLATALALTGISTPIFWSGLILILLFSVRSAGCRPAAPAPSATWSSRP